MFPRSALGPGSSVALCAMCFPTLGVVRPMYLRRIGAAASGARSGCCRRPGRGTGPERLHPRRASSRLAMAPGAKRPFFLDSFALKQWEDPTYQGTRLSCDKDSFLEEVLRMHAQGAELVDGYAPFCKHVFVRNFAGARLNALPITPENEHLLRTGYVQRRPEELPVLSRWFPADLVSAPEAKFLDIILYSREQLEAEREALPSHDGEAAPLPDAPWGVISIKAQDEDYETPMQPITMMRNALGATEGGSGESLDRGAYDASVAYWSRHAAIVG